MNKLFVLLSAIFLTGCVSMEQANQRIYAWDNVTLTDLINSWGVPSKEQEIADRKFYIWNSSNSSNAPTIGISLGSFGGHGGISISSLFGGGAEENFCSRVVEVNAEEHVKAIQWTGDPKLCYDLTPELIQ